MPPLKVLSTEEVCKILRKHGFVIVKGGKGSHIKMEKRLPNHTLHTTIPNRPKGKAIARGTLVAIIWQSEIPRSEFEVQN